MSKMPFVPFYWDDFCGDTTDLDGLQKACYIFCLMDLWKRGTTSEQQMMNICSANFPQKIYGIEPKAIVDSFSGKLKRDDDGMFYSKRMQEEHSKAMEISEKRKNARAARGKSKKTSEEQESNTCSTNEEQMRVNPHPHPHPHTLDKPIGLPKVRESTPAREIPNYARGGDYPNLDEFLAYAEVNLGHYGLKEEELLKMFRDAEASGWANADGKPWGNWKSKMTYKAEDAKRKRSDGTEPMVNKHHTVEKFVLDVQGLLGTTTPRPRTLQV